MALRPLVDKALAELLEAHGLPWGMAEAGGGAYVDSDGKGHIVMVQAPGAMLSRTTLDKALYIVGGWLERHGEYAPSTVRSWDREAAAALLPPPRPLSGPFARIASVKPDIANGTIQGWDALDAAGVFILRLSTVGGADLLASRPDVKDSLHGAQPTDHERLAP